MFIYNVTVKIESRRSGEWLKWMKEEHIPQVMSTGCFTENRVCRIVDDGETDGVTFAVQYTAKTLDDYLDYKSNYAPALQTTHNEKFKDDFVAFRTLMEVL